MTTNPDRSHVVVLTTPDGRRILSSTSLLTEEEAEGEAASWRRTRPPSGRGTPWPAEVCMVLTAAEMAAAGREVA